MFASKAFPCTAVLELFAQEGLWCDVASGGELHLALNAGFPPERIVLHGNAKSERGAAHGARSPRGADRDRQLRRDRAARAADRRAAATVADGAGGQPVLVRVTPDVGGETHEKISTGQADSKFGFAMAEAREAIERLQAIPRADAAGAARAHRLAAARAGALSPRGRRAGDARRVPGAGTSAAASASRYTAEQPQPPAIEEYVARDRRRRAAHGMGPTERLLIEPGRALCANACVTLYTVESVKQNVSRWVAVDGGMSDNLRPMLYGARLRSPRRRPLRRLDRVRAGGQALRVGRCDRARGAARRPARRAT